MKVGDTVNIKQEFIDRCGRSEFNSTDEWTITDIYPIGDGYYVASILNDNAKEDAELRTCNLQVKSR